MKNSREEVSADPIQENNTGPISMGKVFNLEKLYLNGDQTNVVNAGETYELTVELFNKSENALMNLQASLGVMGVNSDAVEIMPNRLSLPPIDAGGRVISGHFTIKVLSDIYLPKEGGRGSKDFYRIVDFSLKIFQDASASGRAEMDNVALRSLQGSPDPGMGEIDRLAFQLRAPDLVIVSSSFAISDQEANHGASLVAFIKIMNHGDDLSKPTAQLIINGIGSTKENLKINDIRQNEQKQELYGILLDPSAFAANGPLNQAKLTGCLKIKSTRDEVPLRVEMPVPFISVCVVQSNDDFIGFEENVDVDLKPDDRNIPSAAKPTDENGNASFSQGEVGVSNTVTLSLPHRDVSRTLPVSLATKHHCTFLGALTASKIILRRNIANTGIISI